MADHRSRGDSPRRRLNLEKLEPRALLAVSDLRITEFLASNDEVLLDAQGDASDWIEIYNSGADAVSLSGLHLTDNATNKTKWAFPADVTIPAGGYRIVFASSKNTVLAGGELHTNFAISADGEYLGLIGADGVTVIDEYAPNFPPQEQDVSYGLSMETIGGGAPIISNGAQGRGWVPTSSVYDTTWREVDFDDTPFNLVGPTGFGYENNPGDAINYTAEIGRTIPNTTRTLYLRIPFTLDSVGGIDKLTLRMRYDDGFVAYINGEFVHAENAPDNPQWNSFSTGLHDDGLAEQFISFDASSVIPHLRAGENVLAIHALNTNGGSDMLISPELVAESSRIMVPETVGFFDVPTPGYANGISHLGFVDEPTFNVPHGFYTAPQMVSLSTTTSGAMIVYTTNASTPTVNAAGVVTNGTLYTGPINVANTTTLRAAAFKTDFKPSFVSAQTYLFLDDVIIQSPLGQTPAGFPNNGQVNGHEMNYGIDPAILSLYGAEALKQSLRSIPSISLTTDSANLFSAATGIYVNPGGDGRPWERPTSIELINPDGSEGFATNAGLRIRGGFSRSSGNPKHGFRLFFRGDYGDGKLDYELFGDEGVDEFDVIDLRSDQNYSWAFQGDGTHSFVREVFGRDIQRDQDQPYTRSRWYHLYLNGQYWGVYQSQERVEENYAAAYYGGDPEDYDIFKHGDGAGDGRETLLTNGNEQAWFQLFTLAQNMATNPAANANNYYTMQGLNPDGTRNPALPVLLDVDNLIDYELILFYTGGSDSGLSAFLGDNAGNNWFGIYNRVAADEGFKFFIHDNEHSLGVGGSPITIDRTGPFNTPNQNSFAYFNPGYLHQDLMAHPEYRQRFIEHATASLTGSGLMTLAANRARLQARVDQVEPAVISESARWGDSQREPPFNKTHWQTQINYLLNTYFPNRTNTVLSQLRTDGLYVIPATLSPPGGPIVPGTMLTITMAGAGTIYYTTDGGTDPRLVGGAVNPSPEVKIYTGPIEVQPGQKVLVRNRTANGAWSVLIEANFTGAAQPGDFNGDGIVTGNDFLVWQQSLGGAANPPGSGADGNGNGSIDAADLAVWGDNFGPAAAIAVAADAEFTLPANALLLMPEAGTASAPAEPPSRIVDEVFATDLSSPADPLPARPARPTFRPAALRNRLGEEEPEANHEEDAFEFALADFAL
jgi:hypothetical protein